MPEHDKFENLARSLEGLEPKGKPPNSARVLNTWIAQARIVSQVLAVVLGGAWLVASVVLWGQAQSTRVPTSFERFGSARGARHRGNRAAGCGPLVADQIRCL